MVSCIYFLLACIDLWGKYVSKKGPITVSLDKQFQELFSLNDLSKLITNTIVGETYTMVLEVTSTCQNEVEIGFSGHGGWLKAYAPANAKATTITATSEWKEADLKVQGHRFESRTVCRGKSLTIHHIQLVKGSENCFEDGN